MQHIFNNPESKPPARIECWNLRLQGYDFKVAHIEGTQNPSDYLSRHSSINETRQSSLAEEYVNFLSSHAVPKAMTLDEIQRATVQDRTLQCVTHLVRTQEWDKLETLPPEFQNIDHTELNLFKHVKDELTVNDSSTSYYEAIES